MTRFELLDLITPPALYILPLTIAGWALWQRKLRRVNGLWLFVIIALGGALSAALLDGAVLLAWVTSGQDRGTLPDGEWRRELEVLKQGVRIGLGAAFLALVARDAVRAQRRLWHTRSSTGGTTP